MLQEQNLNALTKVYFPAHTTCPVQVGRGRCSSLSLRDQADRALLRLQQKEGNVEKHILCVSAWNGTLSCPFMLY